MLERLSEGTVVLVIGMVIVFSVLILLWAILQFGFKTIFYDIPNKKKTQANAVKAEPKAEPVPAAIPEVKAETDDTELVAAITAAICACLNTSASGFRIKSIKRRNNWKKQNY